MKSADTIRNSGVSCLGAIVVLVGSKGKRLLRPGIGSAVLVAFAIFGLVPASPVAAAGFCENAVVRDYAQPLEKMPALRAVPADHELDFGPRGVYLIPHASRDHVALADRAGKVGYTLKIPSKSSKSGNPNLPPLNWLVTVKLTRVNSSGRVRQLIGLRRKRVTGPGDNGSFGLDLPAELGFYRVEIVFRNGANKRLGRFGEYFRILPAISDARLMLNRTSFRPGETLSACLENYGTTEVGYGGCVDGSGSLYGQFSIQYFDGSAWNRLQADPPGLCAGVGLSLGPGRATNVGSFYIPTDALAGLYRATIDEASLTAEFHILPPS